MRVCFENILIKINLSGEKNQMKWKINGQKNNKMEKERKELKNNNGRARG